MRRNSWDWIVECGDQSRQNVLTILFLEIFSHVITDLTNAVEGSMSDLWVRVLQVLENSWHHS